MQLANRASADYAFIGDAKAGAAAVCSASGGAAMGCVPGFEYDLFVSYAHIDDAPDVGRAVGWVATLKDNLKTRLDRRLGIRSSIWMDQRLVAESQLSAPILAALQRSAGLLVVLSRAYLNSPWCARERGGFLDGLQDRRGQRRPLFIVECDDLEHEPLPEAFGDLLRLRFWQRETEGAAPLRLGDPLPTLEDRQYWARLNDLAFRIAEGLTRMQGAAVDCAPAAAAPGSAGPAVFLAEVGDELMDEYERLQRSLEQAGVAVLPERAYPRTDPDSYAAAMSADLRRSRLFVQLLGEYPGRVRGWGLPLAALQYRMAQRASVPVRRWRRFGLAEEDIRDLTHRQLVFATDVVNEGLEDFAAGVLAALRPAAAAAPPPAAGELLVFVNHDRDDARVAAELCDFFDAQGLGFLRPEPQDSTEAMRADLQDNLRLCDGLVVVYGSTQPVWVRQQLKETLKIKSVRERPLGRVVLCQAEPDEAKADPGIKLPNQRVIDCRRGIDAGARQALAEFVRELRGGAP